MKYKVRITETPITDIEVTASSKEEAVNIVRNNYKMSRSVCILKIMIILNLRLLMR